MNILCGIDEAGRGPVIGPMVMCGFLIDEKESDKLKELGVKDSKLLTAKKREELYEELKTFKHFTIVLNPVQIDEAVQSTELNLNWLEAITSAKIINELKPKKAIVDCPSVNINSYHSYLKKLLNLDCELVAEHKADLNYPVVSAASIIAKVTRDRLISELREKHGDFGSGYPSDSKTQEFLKKNYIKNADIFRKSWQCYKDVIERKTQKSLFEF